MQVKATYENGAINFAQPLRFKHRKFEVVVSIPEEELESGESKTPVPQAVDNKTDVIPANQSALDTLLAQTPNDPWLQRMKAIESRVLSIPDEQIPDLTAKQLDRIEAFALREDC